VVTIGQKSQQDFMSVVKVLWDADRDGFATYTYDRPDLFAVGTVFGLYMD
jgi:tctex1 domain-containing protein 2